MLTLKQGEALVKFARKVVEHSLKNKPLQPLKNFNEKQGVFVTLLTFPEHDLRGCIGFPHAELPLVKAVMEAAKAAAFSDPRFPSLGKDEFARIIVEISVLTEPKEIKCKKEDLIKNIKIGKDGLIVNFIGYSGLLLPQVPVEWKWNAEEFIKQICIKAGLHQDAWKNPECKIYKFQAQIFSEEKPNGKIVERKI